MTGRDLYGAVGFPRCVTRTVIVGKDVALIEQILRVLTYFIRCSELTENTEECPLLTVDIDIDTTTLMSTSDTSTPVGCSTADVTLMSTSVKTTSLSASGEKAQLTVSDSSPALVLKPAPKSYAHATQSSSVSTGGKTVTATCDTALSSNARGTHVHFQNGGDSDMSRCFIASPKSEDLQSRTVFESSASTTAIMAEQSEGQSANTQPDSRPQLLFCSNVFEALRSVSGLTCSGCDVARPCDDCRETFKKSVLEDDCQTYVDDLGCCKPSHCSISGAPSNPFVGRNCGEVSSPSSDSPKPCHLSPMSAIEDVRVERVNHVGRKPAVDRQPQLHRIPLEKPSDSRSTSTPSPEDQIIVRQLPQYQRGISMFDELYDGTVPVIDLCTGPCDKPAFTFGADDSRAFDEIMNEPEPCPDVSHFNVSQLSGSSSSSDMVSAPPVDQNNIVPPSSLMSGMVFHQRTDGFGISEALDSNTVTLSSELVSDPVATKLSSTLETFDSVFSDSDVPSISQMAADPIIVEPSLSLRPSFDNVFVDQHFVSIAGVNSDGQHLDDLPDGPSRQLISSAIKLMQDVYSQTSQSSAEDLDVPAVDYFSQTGLGPSPRGRQRHPSGQSNTSAARCWYLPSLTADYC